jgi:tRNA A37 threonylcarbamoyladenosine dehydratase
MEKRLERFAALVGEDKVKALRDKNVLICGLGGVGGTALESLARSGIGHFTIVDYDVVEISNLNRQILFTNKDVGKPKVEAARERVQTIDESIIVTAFDCRVDDNFLTRISGRKFDFVIDAIDAPEAKVQLIKHCLANNLLFISSMGMANRLDPTAVRIANLAKTDTDPLAKKMRMLMRREQIDLADIPVVYSLEKPLRKGSLLASVMNVPSAAGLALSSYCLEKIQK